MLIEQEVWSTGSPKILTDPWVFNSPLSDMFPDQIRSLTCAICVCCLCVCCLCLCDQARGSRVLGVSTEWKLMGGWAASAVSETGEGVRVGQAAPLHRACAEQSRLGRWELVVTLVLLVLLLEIHLTVPEGVQGEAGAATAGRGCGWGRGVVLSEAYRGDKSMHLSEESTNPTWYRTHFLLEAPLIHYSLTESADQTDIEKFVLKCPA